ncbi:hypothetical protein RUM44_007648 [Polyplax serrata]|uniref:Cadherin domain-containing protein n=1 Tax=Polyplax serrata TaxID=468196 RepID=A0ABR1BA29_POLSC
MAKCLISAADGDLRNKSDAKAKLRRKSSRRRQLNLADHRQRKNNFSGTSEMTGKGVGTSGSRRLMEEKQEEKEDAGQIKTAAVFDVETKAHYWVTVYAQDHGVIRLSSRLEVFIAIENENDNAPLTDEPIYYASVPENSGAGKVVVELKARDADKDNNNQISYKITAGNPQSYFTIDANSGVIKTTERKLDRENQAEHSLERTSALEFRKTKEAKDTRINRKKRDEVDRRKSMNV